MAPKEKSQSEKFIEKAKELGADESGETFKRAINKIITPPLKAKVEQKAPSKKPRRSD